MAFLLAVAIALAWAFVVLGPTGMGAGPLAFVAAWTVMMVAMMLPSATPFVLLYRRGATAGATAALTLGYLLIWAVAGVPPYVAHELLPMTLGPIALAAAGIYQLTPLKPAGLAKGRSAAPFNSSSQQPQFLDQESQPGRVGVPRDRCPWG